MALNVSMHDRNPYKKRKPDFKKLALKYPQFREHAVQDLKGKVHLDFKKPECLRALSWALLKDDFDLDVYMPLDRLIPTIPLRLNYILWIEDIIQCLGNEDIRAIDIGCGSSCVYGLLGSKKNGWQFLSSEADLTNYENARKNVTTNRLTDKVKVVKVDEGSGLYDLLADEAGVFDFCLCNPPFYANSLDAWGSNRKEDRPDAKSISTASPGESITSGGEVAFVKKIIQDSLLLKDKVRVYTTMLGKKADLGPLKEELRKNKIANVSQTEFCQGRTMRWGLAWSFDASVQFPIKTIKKKKNKDGSSQQYFIPHVMIQQASLEYTVMSIASKVSQALDELKIFYEPIKASSNLYELEMVAKENTWSHQRRKRRQEMLKNSPNKKLKTDNSDDSILGTGTDKDLLRCTPAAVVADKTPDSASTTKDSMNVPNVSEDMDVSQLEEFLVKCLLQIKKDEDDILLKLTFIDGEFQYLIQIMQYFKNILK